MKKNLKVKKEKESEEFNKQIERITNTISNLEGLKHKYEDDKRG